MKLPAFFDQVPALRLRDSLAAALGAAEGGVLEYRYADAVKWAGHSCPTVAGAWLMTRAGLGRLYGDALPERGGIRVDVREHLAEGVAGVVGGVIGLITGAAGEGGFGGLGGRHVRRGLLRHGVALEADLRLTRLDDGRSVSLEYRPAAVSAGPELPALQQKLLSGQATPEEAVRFGVLWQDRVRRLLLEHADDPEVVRIRA